MEEKKVERTGAINYSIDMAASLIRLVGAVTLAAYAVVSLIYLVGNWNRLVDFEETGLESLSQYLDQPVAAIPIAGLLLAIVIGFVIICILVALFAIFVYSSWVERVSSEWVKVVNCDWLKSVADFFKCLAGALFTLVETIILVLVFFIIIIVTSINVAPFVA